MFPLFVNNYKEIIKAHEKRLSDRRVNLIQIFLNKDEFENIRIETGLLSDVIASSGDESLIGKNSDRTLFESLISGIRTLQSDIEERLEPSNKKGKLSLVED